MTGVGVVLTRLRRRVVLSQGSRWDRSEEKEETMNHLIDVSTGSVFLLPFGYSPLAFVIRTLHQAAPDVKRQGDRDPLGSALKE